MGKEIRKETDWLGNEKEVIYENNDKVGEIRKESTLWGTEVKRECNTEGEHISETRHEQTFLGTPVNRTYNPQGERTSETRHEQTFLGTPVDRTYNNDNDLLYETKRETTFWGIPVRRVYSKEASAAVPQKTSSGTTFNSDSAPAIASATVSRWIAWLMLAGAAVFLLGLIGLVSTRYFVVHNDNQVGPDPALISRYPGLAVAQLFVSRNPDAEVIRTNDNAGTITVRDRKSGKVMTFTFDDVRRGKTNMKVQGDGINRNTAEEIGATAKLPPWVPTYPGATFQGTPYRGAASKDGAGEAGSFTFTTSDPARKVMSFYEDKAKDLGMTAKLTTHIPDGGMLMVTDEERGRTLNIVVGKSSPNTTAAVTYSAKR